MTHDVAPSRPAPRLDNQSGHLALSYRPNVDALRSSTVHKYPRVCRRSRHVLNEVSHVTSTYIRARARHILTNGHILMCVVSYVPPFSQDTAEEQFSKKSENLCAQ
jgi:hypothetical protein